MNREDFPLIAQEKWAYLDNAATTQKPRRVLEKTKAYASIFANFSYVYGMAVSQAGQIMVGYLIGADDTENTEKRVWQTLKIAMLTAFVISVIIYFISDYCFGFFTDNKEIIELGKKIMFIDIFLELGRACNMIFVRAHFSNYLSVFFLRHCSGLYLLIYSFIPYRFSKPQCLKQWC